MSQRWDGIDEFVAVAAAGSFVAGATALGRSTSQVSRAIARLEAALHAQLFYRTTRQVSLTATGRVLLERCREVIRQRDEALDLASGHDQPQGELRVTCSTAIGDRFLAPILAGMARDFPKLGIALELSNRLVDIVGEGFDLAIRTGQLSDSRLRATRIASRRLRLCAAPAYLEVAGRPRSVEELDRHACLLGSAANWRFQVDGEECVYRPQGRWRCNSGEAVLAAAFAGLGICQLPEFYVLPFIRTGVLEPVLENCRPPDETVWAVYPNRRYLLPNVQHLVERLKAELGAALAPPAG